MQLLIADWKQTPAPACLYKPTGPLLDATGSGSFEELGSSPDSMALPRAILGQTFNQAVPELICPAGNLGRTI